MSNRSLLIGWRQQWNRSLFQFLRRRARVPVDVEDLAQETYLRLLRARDLSEIRNPHAYVLRVARHVALEWRDQQPSANVVVDFDEDMLVDEHSPELELDAQVSQSLLEQTLAGFSPTMRAVVLMKLREDRSYEEIAQELRLTLRQVRRHLERGYERLREVMEDE